ncbi:MAG: hypothetical protein KDD44_11345 [Bdellovibrionales bacterium]|nr:hypothetical protein [Bdellovibrionales bacterium]
MERFQQNRRIILIALLAMVLVCLVAVLIYNVFFAAGGQDVAVEPPTATVSATDEAEEGDTSPTPEGDTPTPTRVISGDESDASEGESDEEATVEPTTEATTEPTATPAASSSTSTSSSNGTSSSTAGDFSTTTRVVEVEVEALQDEDILENGDFEEGFGDDGIGVNWQGFGTSSAVVNFTSESAVPFVESGESAQRISIDKGVEPDQYGGIYQKVEVTPGQVYTLTINGQIRSGFGSVDASSYGYRVQYAIDYDGGENWRAIPAEDWMELPWDEQGFDANEFTFSTSTVEVTPTSDTMTVFIRGWNKWADQTLAEYTLDSLSLVGPVTRTTTITRTETVPVMASSGGESGGTTGTSGSGDELVDGALPVTGTEDVILMQDGRFWGAVVVVLLLILGAVYQAKWSWSRSNR